MPFTVPNEEPELPVGNHNVTVIAARTGLSQKGNEIIFLDLEELGSDNPRTHTALLTITPKAMFRVRAAFDALSVDLPAGGEEFDEEDLVGRTANIEIVDQDDGYPPKVGEWAPLVGSDIPDDLPPAPVEPKGSQFDNNVP